MHATVLQSTSFQSDVLSQPTSQSQDVFTVTQHKQHSLHW